MKIISKIFTGKSNQTNNSNDSLVENELLLENSKYQRINDYIGIRQVEVPVESQLKCINDNPESILYMANPTKEAQLESLKHNPKNITLINNPCEEAIDYLYNNETKVFNENFKKI